MSKIDPTTFTFSEAPYSANFKLVAPNGVETQFTVRVMTPADILEEVRGLQETLITGWGFRAYGKPAASPPAEPPPAQTPAPVAPAPAPAAQPVPRDTSPVPAEDDEAGNSPEAPEPAEPTFVMDITKAQLTEWKGKTVVKLWGLDAQGKEAGGKFGVSCFLSVMEKSGWSFKGYKMNTVYKASGWTATYTKNEKGYPAYCKSVSQK